MPVVPCPPNTPVVKGVVEFDAEEFLELYAEFVLVPEAALGRNFVWAEILLKNTCCSRVVDANKRLTLLYLLTAHITLLFDGTGATPSPAAVGRVSDATEGSVSVTLDYGTLAPGEAWYVQTRFGAMYWQMTAGFRTFMYVPAPMTCADDAALAGYYPSSGSCGQ